MTRVLLTGGTGFIAAHVLDTLLKRGHSVVATVRSEAKAKWIREAHPSYGKDKLDTAIVEDISQLDAFDKAVISDPPFEAVIHTASPFHFNGTDNKRDILDPAINGTTGILKAIKRSAPTVKRVVITSSFAAIINPARGTESYEYSEADWNPVTMEEALKDPAGGYRGSKTLAEKAAWEFVEKEKPNFDLVTMNPPLVMGPVVHYLNSLDAINTSCKRFRDLASGACKNELPPAGGIYLWVDVRDLADAHVLGMETAAAGGQRFFIVQGFFNNKELAEYMGKRFPELQDKLPSGDVLKAGDYPAGGPSTGFNNQRSKDVLGLTYRGLEECVVDTTQSILDMMKKEQA